MPVLLAVVSLVCTPDFTTLWDKTMRVTPMMSSANL